MDFDIISLDNDLKKKLKDDARRPILEKNVAQIDELLRRPDQSESELLAARGTNSTRNRRSKKRATLQHVSARNCRNY